MNQREDVFVTGGAPAGMTAITALRRSMGRPVLMARLLTMLDGHPRLQRRVFRILSGEPEIFRRLLSVHAGLTSPREVAAAGVRLSLKLLTAGI